MTGTTVLTWAQALRLRRTLPPTRTAPHARSRQCHFLKGSHTCGTWLTCQLKLRGAGHFAEQYSGCKGISD